MKKFLIEFVIGILILISFFSIVSGNIGGEEMLTLFAVLLSVFYFPFGFFYLNSIPLLKIFSKKAYRNISVVRGIGSIAAGILLFTATFAIIFRLRILPGANEMLTIAIPMMLLLTVISTVKFAMNVKTVFYRSMLIRSVFYLIFTFILYFISNLSMAKFYHSDKPDYIDAMIKADKDPSPENREKAMEILEQYR